jgi:hypothetical protein
MLNFNDNIKENGEILMRLNHFNLKTKTIKAIPVLAALAISITLLSGCGKATESSGSPAAVTDSNKVLEQFQETSDFRTAIDQTEAILKVNPQDSTANILSGLLSFSKIASHPETSKLIQEIMTQYLSSPNVFKLEENLETRFTSSFNNQTFTWVIPYRNNLVPRLMQQLFFPADGDPIQTSRVSESLQRHIENATLPEIDRAIDRLGIAISNQAKLRISSSNIYGTPELAALKSVLEGLSTILHINVAYTLHKEPNGQAYLLLKNNGISHTTKAYYRLKGMATSLQTGLTAIENPALKGSFIDTFSKKNEYLTYINDYIHTFNEETAQTVRIGSRNYRMNLFRFLSNPVQDTRLLRNDSTINGLFPDGASLDHPDFRNLL